MMQEHKIVVAEAQLPALQLTETAIQTIQLNIKMAEKLVINVLEKDIDYGIHPGTDSFALRDPGASKIINSFNCYPDHKILYSQETDDLITFQVQAILISRQTGNVVGTGIGSCSTMESKYAYRWVETPEDYGYKREELTRRRRGKYRIPNPEIADLGNTILKMATKRAEVDACASLPGVGSALIKLFGTPERKQPDWAGFWGRVAQLGLSEERVHVILGVTSVNQWIVQGKTLDQAIKALSESLAQGKQQDSTEVTPETAPPAEKVATAERDPITIRTITELFKACFDDFNMQPDQVIRELGYSNQSDISELPSECYQKIAAVR